MVPRGRRTAHPSLDGDRWSGSPAARASGFWRSGGRTNDWTIKRQSAFRLASARARLRNHPADVKSPLTRVVAPLPDISSIVDCVPTCSNNAHRRIAVYLIQLELGRRTELARLVRTFELQAPGQPP